MEALVTKIKNGLMTVVIGKVVESNDVLYEYSTYTQGYGNRNWYVRGTMEGETYTIKLPRKWNGEIAGDTILGYNGRKHYLFTANTPEEVVSIIAKENPFAFTDFSSLSDSAFNALCK